MRYDFDRKVDRVGSDCLKYDKREEIFGRNDVIPMWVADMDFETPDFILDAVRKRAEHPVFRYDFRSEGFFNSVRDWVRRRNGWNIESEWIDFTPGVVAGLFLSLDATTGPGDAVVIQPPVYPPFAQTVTANGRRLVNNPLIMAGSEYVVDLEGLDKALEGAKAIMLCNPQNPTGRVFSREELMGIGELCIKHDVVVISDEIHSDLVQKPYRHTHIASLSPELAARTITLVVPSKTFNLAGLSTSVAIIPDDRLRERFRESLSRVHVSGGNIFGNAALEAAYRHGDGWLDECNEYLAGNIELVRDFFAERIPSVDVYHGGGTYLVWLDFRRWGMAGNKLWDFMVEEAGLGFNDGRQFGKEGTGFLRMNVATRRELIVEALGRLEGACVRNGII